MECYCPHAYPVNMLECCLPARMSCQHALDLWQLLSHRSNRLVSTRTIYVRPTPNTFLTIKSCCASWCSRVCVDCCLTPP
jgi:hypothetical protein